MAMLNLHIASSASVRRKLFATSTKPNSALHVARGLKMTRSFSTMTRSFCTANYLPEMREGPNGSRTHRPASFMKGVERSNSVCPNPYFLTKEDIDIVDGIAYPRRFCPYCEAYMPTARFKDCVGCGNGVVNTTMWPRGKPTVLVD